MPTFLNRAYTRVWTTLFDAEGFFEDSFEEDTEKLKNILKGKLKRLESLKELNLKFDGVTSRTIEENTIYALNYSSSINGDIFISPRKYLESKDIIKKNPLKARYVENTHRHKNMGQNKEILFNLKSDLEIRINFYPGDSFSKPL